MNSSDFVQEYKDYVQKTLDNIPDENLLKLFEDKYSVLDLMTPSVALQTLKEALKNSSHSEVQNITINNQVVVTFYNVKIPTKTSVELPTILPLRDYIEEMTNESKFDVKHILKDKKRFNYLPMLYEKLKNTSAISLQEDLPDLTCDPTKYHGNPEEWLESYYDVNFEKRCRYKYHMNQETNKEIKYNGSNSMKPIFYDVDMEKKIKFDFYEMNIKLNEDSEVFLKYMESNHEEKFDLTILVKIKNLEVCYRSNVLPMDYMLESTDNRNNYFFIKHSSGIIFSFIKTSEEYKEIEVDEFPNLNFLKFKNDNDLSDSNILHDETQYHFELNITWPNGLIIQQTRKPNMPLYIRQKYIQNTINKPSHISNAESYRCILSNGTVIKFMDNGNMIFLYGCGRIITCTDYTEEFFNNPMTQRESGESTESLINYLNMIKYEERRSDGRNYLFDNGTITESQPLFVEDIHDVLECSITTEFSDSITYEHKRDGTLVISFLDKTCITTYARFEQDDFIPDFIKLKTVCGDIDVYEGYTTVELAFKVDHPCFASVTFSYNGKGVIITMPENIQVTLSQDIEINFNNEILVGNIKNALVVRSRRENWIKDKLIFSFDNFKERGVSTEPCASVQDYYKNSVDIYDNGKFEVSDNNPIGTIQNKRIFVVDKEYNGFTILSKYEMNRYLKSEQSQRLSVVREINNDNFLDHYAFEHTNSQSKWTKFDNFINILKNERKLTTYGSEWYFPFRETKENKEICPEALTVRVFREIKNMTDLIDELQLMLYQFSTASEELLKKSLERSLTSSESSSFTINIDEDSISPSYIDILSPIIELINNPQLTLDTYKKGPFFQESKCEQRDSKKFIKDKLLYQIKQSIYQVYIDKIKVQLQEDKKNLLNNRILPYFESAEGIAATIIQEILVRMYKLDEEKRDEKELETLLLTPLKVIGPKELKRMEELLKKVKWVIENEKLSMYPLAKILDSGKKLEHYFLNMKDVLEFHEDVNSDKLHICP